MLKGKLVLQLQKLGLVESYNKKFKNLGPTSYFRGSQKIDGIWYARNIVPTAVSISIFHFGVGCHRAYVVDLQMKSIIDNIATLCLW